MKGIELIKRMPLELQKEFAREFVKQKSKNKLIQYLEKDFDNKHVEFYTFISEAFVWIDWHYWYRIAFDPYFNALPTKSKPTKKK